MTAQAQAKSNNQKPVNPVLLVILALVVVGGGAYYAVEYFTGTTTVTVQQSVVTKIPSAINKVSHINGDNSIQSTENDGDIRENAVNIVPDSVVPDTGTTNRDPFEPSRFLTQATNADDNYPPTEEHTVVPGPIAVGTPQTTATQTAPDQSTTSSPVWNGTVSSAADQVVLIKYQNRSYSLRLGDKLPGADYRVAQINPDSLILSSPKGKLQLNRKKMEVNQP